MLTVKHIEVTGQEVLYPATRVSYHPRAEDEGSLTGCAAHVSIETHKGDIAVLGHWGAFYIMNDAGKTVAKYDLGGWDTPPKTVSTTWTATGGTSAPDSVRVTRVG